MEHNKIDITITPAGSRHVEFFVRSPLIEGYFRARSTGTSGETSNKAWKHLEKYELRRYPVGLNYHFDLWGDSKLFYRGLEMNLSFLRAVGLSEGITIKMRTDNDHRRIKTYLKAAIQSFVKDEITRRVEGSVTYTSPEELETSQEVAYAD